MPEADLLIRDARIIDGTGNPWYFGDVAVADDRILAITPPGQFPAHAAAETLDAAGHVLCPGFIDIQSHAIISLMRDGRCLSKIAQGVTTEIMGETWTPAPAGGLLPDPLEGRADLELGDAAADWRERARTWTRFSDWLEAMVAQGVGPNVGSFLSGSVVRRHAMGMAMGTASSDQLDTMRRVTAQAMEDGAFGVSYALIYPPDVYTETDEIVEVCKTVAEHGGLYITHMRSESDGIFDAVDEALAIGRRAELPVEIYHLKVSGQKNWDKMPRVIETISAARAAGQDVTACMYPYVASGTGLTAILPPWAAEGGRLFERLADPVERREIREAVLSPAGGWEQRASASTMQDVMPVGFQKEENRAYLGLRLDEIARRREQDPVDAMLDLLVSEGQRIFTLYFRMSEQNTRLQLAQPWIKVASDAGAYDPADARAGSLTHPRAYGTFPRVLGHYARDEGVLSLEEAVRKMTSAVANRLGMTDRGVLRPGALADLVIFNPRTVTDRATFDAPHQLATGIRDVFVNGRAVWKEGQATHARPGRFVRRSATAAVSV